MSEYELKEVKVPRTVPNQLEPRANSHCLAVCKDTDHRKLAIWSIICGFSCCGIMSLIYSVKARETRKRLQNEECQGKVKEYSEKAYKWGIGSIVAWLVLILILPFLIIFLSYIVTFID